MAGNGCGACTGGATIQLTGVAIGVGRSCVEVTEAMGVMLCVAESAVAVSVGRYSQASAITATRIITAEDKASPTATKPGNP